MQKTAGAPSEAVPLSSRRRTGGEWLGPATLPHHEQAMPRNRAAMHKQLSSPKRSPPPHTPLKHPAMSLLCIHIPQNSCTIFVILLCRGRLIAANSIYLINIVRPPHVGRAATKIPSRLQIKGNTAQFPPCGLSTAPAAAARHLRCQNRVAVPASCFGGKSPSHSATAAPASVRCFRHWRRSPLQHPVLSSILA